MNQPNKAQQNHWKNNLKSWFSENLAQTNCDKIKPISSVSATFCSAVSAFTFSSDGFNKLHFI